jgi:hypothetical protein
VLSILAPIFLGFDCDLLDLRGLVSAAVAMVFRFLGAAGGSDSPS